MPGCGTARLIRDLEEPSRFTSFAPWESFESQRDWRENDEFRSRTMRVRRHVDDSMPTTFELVAEVG